MHERNLLQCQHFDGVLQLFTLYSFWVVSIYHRYHCHYYYFAPVGERNIVISLFYLCVCLYASISLEPLDRSSRNVLCRSPVAMARSSSGSVAMRYVGLLPVLCLAVVGRMALCVATSVGSLMSMNALLVWVPMHVHVIWRSEKLGQYANYCKILLIPETYKQCFENT